MLLNCSSVASVTALKAQNVHDMWNSLKDEYVPPSLKPTYTKLLFASVELQYNSFTNAVPPFATAAALMASLFI
jgi:hypothetical protein